MREHVVAASKAMKKGDWKQCSEYILAVKVTEVNMKQIFTDRRHVTLCLFQKATLSCEILSTCLLSVYR